MNRADFDVNKNAGLFATTDSATLANFSLVGGSIIGGYSQSAGAIAAYAYFTNVWNLSSDLDVTAIGGTYVGGLFGQLVSYSDLDNKLSALSNSFSTGQVTGSYSVGGLVGYAYNATISNSYYNSLVSNSGDYSGGLVGYASDTDIGSSYAAGGVTSEGYYDGGLVGYAGGSNFIYNSFAANTVEGGDMDYVGALVGYLDGDLAFDNSNYDAGLSGLTNCLGGNPDTEECYAVNTMEDQNTAYYMNNSANAPLNTWDFEGGWATTDSYPVLQGFSLTPNTPSNLHSTKATSSRVFLDWTSVSGADSYEVQYRPTDGDEEWIDYNHTNGDASDTTVNGLTHNTEYQFRVRSVNTNGSSSETAPITVSTTSQIYNITNCDQLQDVAGDLDGSYKLMNGINCSATEDWNGGAGFWPIANFNWAEPFTGTLDGDGWAIDGLTINRASENDDSSALFYATSGGATIKDFSISGDVVGRYSAGAVVAFAHNSFIENIQSSVNVTSEEEGEACTGGLVACYNVDSYEDGHIMNSSTSGNISGKWGVGGIVGYAYKLVLSHSYSTSLIAGESSVGGIGGLINDSFVADVYSRGGVYADEEFGYVGGLFGSAGSTLIVRSYSSDLVVGDKYVGGLIGESSNTQIQSSFSESAVSGNDAASNGGVIGHDGGGTVLLGVYFDQTRTEQENCIGDAPDSCLAFNADGSDEFHYYGSTSLTPLDQWDFEGVWVAHDDDLPTLAGTPSQGDSDIVVVPTTTSITVKWGVVNDNGSPVTGYELFYKKHGTSTWIPVTIDPVLSTEATVAGLTPSTQYDFSWRPFNAYGGGTRVEFYTWTKDAAAPATAKSVVVITSTAKAESASTTDESSSGIYLDDFTEYALGTGKQLELTVGQVVHFTVIRDDVKENHTATVKEVGVDYVTLTIASTPFDVRVNVGETKTITIEGLEAIQISLNSISDGIASIQFSRPSVAPLAAAATTTQSQNTSFSELFGIICLLISAYLVILALKPRNHQGHVAAAH